MENAAPPSFSSAREQQRTTTVAGRAATVQRPHGGTSPSADAILGVLAKAGAIFFRWDSFRGLVFVSANVREILGYSPEELLEDQELMRRIVDPEFIPRLERVAADFFVASREAARVEIPFLARSGKRVVLEARFVPDIDKGGHITGFLGIAFEAGAAPSEPAPIEGAAGSSSRPVPHE